MTEKATDMESDLRSRMVSVEHTVQGNSQRLATLEAWQRQRDIDSARNDERWGAMESRIETRFNSLESSIRDVQGSLSWINKLVIGGIIAGVVAFLIQGGFAT